MKRTQILLAAICLTSVSFAGTRHLGNYSYINTDGPIRIAVNASVAAKHLEREYLPFVVYMGADMGVTATVQSKEIALVYKGKKYFPPALKELREKYNRDIQDMVLLSKETEHIFPSEMSVYRFQPWVDFYPSRTQVRTLVSKEVTLSGTEGVKTKLYFKNPGIQKGDTATIEVVDKNHPDIYGKIQIKF